MDSWISAVCAANSKHSCNINWYILTTLDGQTDRGAFFAGLCACLSFRLPITPLYLRSPSVHLLLVAEAVARGALGGRLVQSW